MTGQHSLKHQQPAAAATAAPASDLLRLIFGAWPAQAIAVAAQLGIADLLADGPRPCSDLAVATQCQKEALYRLMRALASVGVFAEDESGRFRLTPMAEHLRSDAPVSLRGYALRLRQEWVWRACGSLLRSVQTGKPSVEHIIGMPVFDYLAAHPEAAQAFDAAMTSRSSSEDKAIAAAYDFSAGTIVDIGGGRGSLVASVLQQHPKADGILFDLPHVLKGAATVLRTVGVEARCRLQAGDFFTSVPPGGDIYMMKKIIHDWDDERAGRILARCRAAMTGEGRLLILEQVIRPGNGPSLGKLSCLQMLALTPGGRERTEVEYRSLLAGAGLELVRIIPTGCPLDVVEARPA
jgi:hypothetical protein